MHVIVLAATKGGVGKSTLTCALAVCALDEGAVVALLDCDPQGTTRDWHTLRGSPLAPRLLTATSVGEALSEADAAGVEWVFIDTPPSVVNLIEPAVRQADLVLVPVRPSPVDLLAIDPIVGLCELHKRQWRFVLNQVPARTTFAEDAAKQLKKVGQVLECEIGTRNAFAMAMAGGRTGPEVDRSDGKSREEMLAVWAHVKRLVTNRK
jgi:chromosome partitioning protein